MNDIIIYYLFIVVVVQNRRKKILLFFGGGVSNTEGLGAVLSCRSRGMGEGDIEMNNFGIRVNFVRAVILAEDTVRIYTNGRVCKGRLWSNTHSTVAQLKICRYHAPLCPLFFSCALQMSITFCTSS
jgi:hypothetical protein